MFLKSSKVTLGRVDRQLFTIEWNLRQIFSLEVAHVA